MDCEFELCIYNKNKKCAIEKITINELGMCDMCLIATVEKDILEREKRKTIESLNGGAKTPPQKRDQDKRGKRAP